MCFQIGVLRFSTAKASLVFKGGFMNRRNFLKIAGLTTAALTGARALAQSTGEQCAEKCIQSEIGFNHGHLLILPRPATAGTYSIQGASGHPHFVTVTEEQLAQLEVAKRLEIMSTLVAGHQHPVTLFLEA